MAQKTISVLIDDLTGKELLADNGQTVYFGLDGANYEIDLDNKTAAQLRTILDRYAQAGRRVTGAQHRRPLRETPTQPSSSAVRAWATANKIPVSNRGRIPESVVQQFRAAGN